MAIVNEEWRPVVGFEGLYEVSNTGRVRSTHPWRGSTTRELTQHPDQKGALRVFLYAMNEQRRSVFVHRLVAESFVQSWHPSLTVDHIDGDRSNNRADNLRGMSHADNCRAFNRKVNGTSPYRGVYKSPNKGKWRSEIKFKGTRFYLGSFNSENEAAHAFNRKASELGFDAQALNHIAK